jgi:hypothetical protein
LRSIDYLGSIYDCKSLNEPIYFASQWRGISLRTTALTFFDPIGAAPALRTVKAFLAEKTDSDGVNSWQMR